MNELCTREDPIRDRARRRKWTNPSRRRAGMTLIEIMIVVIIMALIATAVGVAVLPRLKQARIDSSRTDAQSVRSMAIAYIMDNPGSDCPSIEDLVEGSYVDRGRRTTDAWDRAFVIECEGEEVTVISPGPDGEMGTEDDIQ